MFDLWEDWRVLAGLSAFVIGVIVVLGAGLAALPTCAGWCAEAVGWAILELLGLALMAGGLYLTVSWRSRRRAAQGMDDPQAGNVGGFLRSDPWLRSGEPRPPPPKS